MKPESREIPSHEAAADYRSKTGFEISALTRRKRDFGLPPPSGDPASGVMLVVEPPADPRVSEALDLSLDTLGIPDTYVTYPTGEMLLEEILAAEPSVLVALGPEAAREIDGLAYSLALNSFSDATEGVWFSWTSGTTGLLLPALAPALDDQGAKRRFWRAFLSLKDLSGT